VAEISPVRTAFVGLSSLVTKPGMLIAWTLFQLPVGAFSGAVLWFLMTSQVGAAEVVTQPESFLVGLLVVTAFLTLSRPMLRSIALRAGIEPGPGAEWRLRWGRAETTLLLFSFTKSGPAPWLENFLAGLIAAGAIMLSFVAWQAWPIGALVLFIVTIWLRVRSSLTYPLVVDPQAQSLHRGTWSWLEYRRTGWELTGRHFKSLMIMETITFSAWLILSAALAVGALVALGVWPAVETLIRTAPSGAEQALTLAAPQVAGVAPIPAAVALAIWLALVSALHMIVCSLPTATAYLAIRPEAADAARRFA
jgi:hypothetical protein